MRNIRRQLLRSLTVLLVMIVVGCGRKSVESTDVMRKVNLSDREVSSLETKKIFFGHQSVGADIIQGIRDLMTEDSRLRLNIVHSADPESIAGPAFVEFPIGENRKPQSKTKAFAAILAKGMGIQGGIAMYKYCYVDIDSTTDIPQLFESYREEIADIKTKYPLIKIVHITVPLTTVDPGLKTWIKSMLGRNTPRDINAKRNQFNSLLRQYYTEKDAIFDLAEVESTHVNGSRSYVMSGEEKVYTLASDLTTDGGHLNESGRRVAAERLLQVLSQQ